LFTYHLPTEIAEYLTWPFLFCIYDFFSEEEGFLDVYRAVTGSFPVRGNLVPNAHLASILHQHGVLKIYTGDRDFVKFDFLDVRDPFI